MNIGTLYWVLWVILLLFGGGWSWRSEPNTRIYVGGVSLIVLVMFFLIGWKLFGFIVQG